MTALWIILGIVGWLVCWATAVRLADLAGSQKDFDREFRRSVVGILGIFLAPALVVIVAAYWLASGLGIHDYMNPVAARDSGRRAVGVELSEQYCEVIARRLSTRTMALDFESAIGGGVWAGTSLSRSATTPTAATASNPGRATIAAERLGMTVDGIRKWQRAAE